MMPAELILFFKNLQLNDEETKICVSLASDGKQTYLNLSRKTGINRTTLYRICDELLKKGVVEIIVEENKQEVALTSLENLREIVQKKEKELTEIKELFPQLETILSSSDKIEQTGTKVLFYRGKENIKQLFWNTLKTNKELLGYTFKDSTGIVGEEFAFKWHDEFIVRGLTMRHLYSENYESTSTDNALEQLLRKKYKHYDAHFKSRFIPSNVLNITTQVDIYNDVVAYYSWHMHEVYAVEIYNQELADMQRQMFEIVWERAGRI